MAGAHTLALTVPSLLPADGGRSFQSLWEGLQRGKEAGALARSDFADEHGQEVLGRHQCFPHLAGTRALCIKQQLLDLLQLWQQLCGQAGLAASDLRHTDMTPL